MSISNEEIWRPAVGYEVYEVSTHGRVRRDGRVLKPCVSGTTKYHRVWLCGKGVAIHRIIAKTFLVNHDAKPCVDHIDGDPTNNNVGNLRWATRSENQFNKRSKSAFKGVKRDRKKWHAHIAIDGNVTHLGSYSTPEEAYWIYCAAAVFYYGEFACG